MLNEPFPLWFLKQLDHKGILYLALNDRNCCSTYTKKSKINVGVEKDEKEALQHVSESE